MSCKIFWHFSVVSPWLLRPSQPKRSSTEKRTRHEKIPVLAARPGLAVARPGVVPGLIETTRRELADLCGRFYRPSLQLAETGHDRQCRAARSSMGLSCFRGQTAPNHACSG